MRQKMDNERMRNKVPGYQGYVPQVKSENVFGTTFGKSTLAQKEGQIKAGFDCGAADRYRSVNQGVYTEQMQQKVFGNQRVGANGTGQITMSFESAKKAADQRRAD